MDIQVAEFAAPIDAEDAAGVVNFLGRMYAGASEEDQALAIIEVQPGMKLGGMKLSGDCGKGWYGRWMFSIFLPNNDPYFWFDNGKLIPKQKRLYVCPFFIAIQF